MQGMISTAGGAKWGGCLARGSPHAAQEQRRQAKGPGMVSGALGYSVLVRARIRRLVLAGSGAWVPCSQFCTLRSSCW
jgi:hypothetical protein